MAYLAVFRRLLVVAMLAIWWGGFTFYALAVIPSGHQVLHSHVKQGFITQRVTEKLNWLGAATLAIALTEVLAGRPQPGRQRLFAGAWLVCAATQVALFCVHSQMDTMLVAVDMVVTDEARFEWIHRFYVCTATVGWMAAGLMLALAASPCRRSFPAIDARP